MKNILITILVAAIISVAAVRLTSQTETAAIIQEDAYDRIMRTKTLRCAHYVYPPFIERDVNTGAMKGIFVDFTNMLAERYGFKVEWVLEVVPGNEIEQMKSGAIDLICGAGPFNAALANQLFFSQPVYYDPASVFVRADGKVKTFAELNRPETVFTALDGDMSYDLAKMMFPNATIKALPGTAGPAQMVEDLRSGKADAAVLENLTMQRLGPQYMLDFHTMNPEGRAYAGFYVNGFAVNTAEGRLLQALNQMVEDMRNLGIEEKMLAPWQTKYPGGIIPVRDFTTLEKR